MNLEKELYKLGLLGILVEEPNNANDEFYAKIWFNYINNDDKEKTLVGHHEFIAFEKEMIFGQVKYFIETFNDEDYTIKLKNYN